MVFGQLHYIQLPGRQGQTWTWWDRLGMGLTFHITFNVWVWSRWVRRSHGLLPLIHMTAQSLGGMTLFTDLTLPLLPVALEVYPLASLKEALDWPDFIALDVPLTRMTELRELLGLSNGTGMPCPAQVLVTTPIPCAGMAQCGACAVPARRGWKLVCEDGPVFDLNSLKW